MPEERQGKQLSESDARIIAHAALHDIYNREPETFKEISAISAKQPDRLDWNFTFADTQNFPLEAGQARILITIAGEQLVDNCRYIHVPEDWVRNQDTDRAIFNLITMICYSLLFAFWLIACILILRRRRINIKSGYAAHSLWGYFNTLDDTINQRLAKSYGHDA